MRKQQWILALLALAVPVSGLLACSQGAVAVSPQEWLQILWHQTGLGEAEGFSRQQASVIWIIRLPRVVLSLLVGGLLALCGAAMQGLFRNPLADPSIIGISAGAVLAAATTIVLGGPLVAQWSGLGGMSALTIATFCGAVLATLFIFRLAREKGRTHIATLLLAGIAINALAGAVTGLLTYLADDAQLRSLTFWTLGSLGGANWTSVGFVSVATLISVPVLLKQGKAFNSLALGEQEATYLGTAVDRLTWQVVLVTALAVGVAVAFCGMIGFLGLVVPHLLRLLIGANHQWLLPASVLGGAVLLCIADTLARTVAAPAEIPIGIVTALAGAPVFLFLLYRQRNAIA